MKRSIIIGFCLSFSTLSFATGNHNDGNGSNDTNVNNNIGIRTSAASNAEAKSAALAIQNQGLLNSNGANANNGGVNIAGSKSFSIGAASAPTPTNCVVVLPEFFGAITITMVNRYDCGIALSHAYTQQGQYDKAVEILDTIRNELNF